MQDEIDRVDGRNPPTTKRRRGRKPVEIKVVTINKPSIMVAPVIAQFLVSRAKRTSNG